MIRYPAEIINKARKLAIQKHLSYREIGLKLNVSDSTVGIWCRDVKGSNPIKYVKTNKNIRNLLKQKDQHILNGIKIDKTLTKIFCGIIYGCEGAKYPATNCISLTNSEPKLIQSFVNLLRISYKIDESKWRVHLQIHSNQNFERLARYWSGILEIPTTKFYKPTVTVAKEGKHRDDYLGTCSVKYYDYKLLLRLIGVYEAFMRKSRLLEGIPNGSGSGLLNRAT